MTRILIGTSGWHYNFLARTTLPQGIAHQEPASNPYWLRVGLADWNKRPCGPFSHIWIGLLSIHRDSGWKNHLTAVAGRSGWISMSPPTAVPCKATRNATLSLSAPASRDFPQPTNSRSKASESSSSTVEGSP